MLAAAPAPGAELPRVLATQALEANGQPLPRPVIGVAAGAAAPVLPFHVALNYRCPAASDRPQVFVSIADSWRLQDASELPPPLVIRVDVPIRQVQWLMEPDAGCDGIDGKRTPDETDAEGVRYYRLAAYVTGFATVTCVAKDGSLSAATATAPLDVWLSCPAPAAAP